MTDNITKIGVEFKQSAEDLLETSVENMISSAKTTGNPALILWQDGDHPNDIKFAANSSDPRKILYLLELAKLHILENGYGEPID